MIVWADLEAAAVGANWRRSGREYRGAPCPACGGGQKDTAWIRPLDDSWGAGCNAGCDGLTVARALTGDDGPGEPARTWPRARQEQPAPATQTAGPLPGAVWRASGTADGTPGAVYLTGRGCWPDGAALPASVRWLSADAARSSGLRPALPIGAAGCLVYRFADGPELETGAAQVEAVDGAGGRVSFGTAGKRPSVGGSRFNGAARVFTAGAGGPDVWIVEGPLDALALVHLYQLGAVDLGGAAIVGAAGVSGFQLGAVSGWPGRVTVAPDDDRAGVLAAVQLRAALRCAGRAVTIRLPCEGLTGRDWSEVASIEAAEREAIRNA